MANHDLSRGLSTGTRWALALLALVVVAGLVFVAFPRREADPRVEFYERLSDGAGCAELTDIRGRLERDDPERTNMDKRLREAGCE